MKGINATVAYHTVKAHEIAKSRMIRTRREFSGDRGVAARMFNASVDSLRGD
jgi:hypothetical protein